MQYDFGWLAETKIALDWRTIIKIQLGFFEVPTGAILNFVCNLSLRGSLTWFSASSSQLQANRVTAPVEFLLHLM